MFLLFENSDASQISVKTSTGDVTGSLSTELADKHGKTHKAIQTSGDTDLETYKKVISCMDYVLQDIKLADSAEHVEYTGVSNEKILKNIEWLIRAIAKIAGDHKVELMPYNSLAGAGSL